MSVGRNEFFVPQDINSSAIKTNPANQNLNQVNKAKITQEYLAACIRITQLKSKPYTTLDEDRELYLLEMDQAILPFINRILQLESKEKLSQEEQKEYRLLLDPLARPYLNRILELDKKTHKTYLEDIEADVLANPKYLPFYQEFIQLAEKLMNHNLNSEMEARLSFLFFNPYAIRHAYEIINLETRDTLTDQEATKLSLAYLICLCKIPHHTAEELEKNYKNTAYVPASGLTINKRLAVYNTHVARFLAVQGAFNAAADEIVDQYYKQMLAAQTSYTLFKDKSNLEKTIKTDSAVMGVLARKKSMVALSLEKIFFDFATPFEQNILNQLSSHLITEIQNKRLILNNNNFKEVFNLLQKSLNNISVEENRQPTGYRPKF